MALLVWNKSAKLNYYVCKRLETLNPMLGFLFFISSVDNNVVVTLILFTQYGDKFCYFSKTVEWLKPSDYNCLGYWIVQVPIYLRVNYDIDTWRGSKCTVLAHLLSAFFVALKSAARCHNYHAREFVIDKILVNDTLNLHRILPLLCLNTFERAALLCF